MRQDSKKKCMVPIESHHHGKEKTSWIRRIACQVFDLQDSEGIIHFHSDDTVWYTPPDGDLDPKKVQEFMNNANLEINGPVRVGTSKGLGFRILNAEKSGLVSKKL